MFIQKETNSMQQCFVAPSHVPFLEIRTTLHSTQPYAQHLHSQFCLGLILQGRTRFSLVDTPHLAVAGDLVLIAPWQAHSCNPEQGQARSYHMLFFDAAWVASTLFGHGLEATGEGPVPQLLLTVARPVLRSPALFQQALAMVEAAQQGGGTPAQWAAFLVTLVHDGGIALANGPTTTLHGMEGEERPKVQTLATQAGMRRESYSRAVRRSTGLPPRAYLHSVRLEQARLMLRRGCSVVEAAQAAGYADQSHFHRMLVKFFAVTPGCYQRLRK
ncbi:AraC family transcriptional regulator [Desulfovibrio cuneatus]|uniref:AraC family transcriptional regulator n=1 Tax=Desulfovibrio cuneatus TaxID=159728 RepID=UPI0004163BDF|nr:helix-turn-helix transcriptional regulator [Desulfovibrio cuneatus]